MDPHNTPFCHPCPPEFFNPWHGQNACFPCGSEATQPEEGKDTCICRKPGRVFQPSDSQCPCLPGYEDIGEPMGCVRKEHKNCKDGSTWNQEGLCLTKEQWNDHCAHEVCPTPGAAHGYDPSLGLCLCWGQQSSGMCGPLCSQGQRHILQLSCAEGFPQISATEGTGSQDFYLLDRPSSPRAVGHPCNLDQGKNSVPLYVIKVNEHGFLGLTRPGPELLHLLALPLMDTRHSDQSPESFLGKLRKEHQPHPWSLSLNSTHSGDMSGIQNPIVCLQTNDTLAFLVTHGHYPEYDLGHFYNTLQQFDWGRFRALAEELQLAEQSPRLFLQQFQLPGVYVFHLNSNRHRKMYLRTLPPGGQCFADGPFASATPRYLIQSGIAKIPKPVKRPHWPGVLGEMMLLLGLCLLLLIQCNQLSWVRKAAPHPIFRTHQQEYNLGVYISSRTGMTSVKRGQSHQECGILRVEENHGGTWEDQVDLEWFDTEAFFEILHRQSLTVTAKLSQTKEQLKVLYLKLLNEAGSLRLLWRAQHRTSASTNQLLGSAQREQQEAAEAVALAAEEESKRRQSLAGQYAASLSHQLELLHQDLCARQGQWASFCSVLMEAQWLLKTPSSSNPGKSPQPGQSPKGVPSQLDILLGHLSQAMLQEGHRLKAWGFLGTGTGAELLQPASACPQEGADDIIVNPVTKLMVPGPNCMMLPVSGHMGPIPPGYFIHPDTGRVLPQTGHLGYDLLKAALIPITDYNADVVRTSEVAVLPYLPYPTSPVTGCPPATRLPTLQPRRTSQLGALMSDPITGIEVPVLAVTLHPQTRQWLTLGGTYCNPLTKTLAPLELGGPMKDPVTGGIVPILGVGLDEHTGQVLAVGGLQDGTGSLLLPGDNFEEPLSGKTVRLLGASQQAGQLLPHPGGSQALLDSNVLVAQRQVILRLQQCQETPGSRAQGLLESAIRDMRRALALSLHHILQQAQRLERQLQAARDIEATGGCIGLMCYPRTELWVPALYGMEIPDPEGSGLMVPILGMHRDGDSGNTTPLAGTMEDTAGKGLVPISIGAQAIDPLTGEHGPVIGAHMDPSARVVVPVVQLLEALPRGVRDPNLQILLEQELRAHQQYWQLREQEEQQLAEHLWHLSQELHFCPGHEATLQLKAAEEACAALEACYLQETERRARALSMLSSPERCLLSQADKKEWEEEAQVLLGVRKVLHSLGQASEKLRKTSTRLQGQAEEVCLQQSEDQSPRVWNHHRKVLQHLSDEFREVVRDRQNFLNRALGNLQYHRELSHLQLLHIQVTVSGTPVCLENYPGDRFYGTVTTCLGNQAALCPLLIPFLKGITAMLIEDQGHHLGLEDQAPAVDADKADNIWTPPLFSIMKKIDTLFQDPREIAELQRQIHLGPHRPGPRNSLQNLLKTQTMQGELVTVQTMHLSAWEFVVYQYGLSVLHLLIPQLQAPETTLQIASHLPAMEVTGNAFEGSFFYQSTENTLFVGRECLASVGRFVLLLIHCLAHITTGDFNQDCNPKFLGSFYEGLKAYFKEAFSTTLQMSAVSWDSKFDQSLSAVLLKEQSTSEKERDLLSKLIERKCEPCLSRQSSEEYIKKSNELLLFTNMEHFLKSILSEEQQ
uniref:Predicted gene, 32742 n=1 Tax=Cricetulus griseus TaxID=10029 RepID=A0A8C2N3W6_CRIGR